MTHLLSLFVAIGLLGLGALPAHATDDGPRLPCGVAPLPAYAEPGAPPNVRAWSGKAARGWPPPSCSTWQASDADMLVGLAGSFRYDGEIDGLLARIGAISTKKGVRYWSTTEKSWQMLVTDAFALSGPDAALRRADFKPEELAKGQAIHYAQSDNRSAPRPSRPMATNSESRCVMANPGGFLETFSRQQ
jgi:hypothetical protein